MEQLSIPSTLTTIGEAAFNGLRSLEYITVANGNGKYDSRNSCNALIETSTNKIIKGCKNTIIPNTITTIENRAFSHCSALTEVTLPSSVVTIGNNAFSNCSNLINITIPNGVTTIGSSAFMWCNELIALTLPESIVSIGNYAFSCSKLATVISYIETPPAANESFGFSSTKTVLYVPDGRKEIYQNTKGWSWVKEIIELKEETVTMPSNGVRSYSNKYGLDFSSVVGLSAYVISGFNASEGTLTLTPVTTVQAGEGLLLKGDAGEYTIPHTTTDATYTNYLVGVPTTTSVSPTDGDYTNFVLTNGKNFYTLSKEENISAGEAYLQLPTAAINQENLSRGFTLFNDATEKCAIPAIAYENGKLNFSCETEGVEYHYTIQTEPISNTGNNVYLDYPQTVLISVYATKEGYEDSDVATKEINTHSLKGDVNGDGKVTVTDAVELMDIILNNGSAPN